MNLFDLLFSRQVVLSYQLIITLKNISLSLHQLKLLHIWYTTSTTHLHTAVLPIYFDKEAPFTPL